MRVALVTNFATHYRLPVFRMLGESLDVDYFFTGAGFKRYWSPLHSIETEGLRVVPTRSSSGLAWALGKGDYDCHVIAVAGRLKLIAALAAAAFLRRPTVLWVGIWEHPRTLFHRMTRPLLAILYRKADALVVYGPHVAAHVAAESGRTSRVFVARQAVDNERFGIASDDDRARARAQVGREPPLQPGEIRRQAWADCRQRAPRIEKVECDHFSAQLGQRARASAVVEQREAGNQVARPEPRRGGRQREFRLFTARANVLGANRSMAHRQIECHQRSRMQSAQLGRMRRAKRHYHGRHVAAYVAMRDGHGGRRIEAQQHAVDAIVPRATGARQS